MTPCTVTVGRGIFGIGKIRVVENLIFLPLKEILASGVWIVISLIGMLIDGVFIVSLGKEIVAEGTLTLMPFQRILGEEILILGILMFIVRDRILMSFRGILIL